MSAVALPKRAVLLDKNSGAKKLRDHCRAQGVVDCFMLPPSIRDAPDDEVLEFAIKRNRLTVTFDRPLYLANARVLSGRNPGVLLLRMDDNSNKRITRKAAMEMLEAFKRDFPQWHTVPWKNSVIELTPSLVFVYRTASDDIVENGWCHRSDPAWQSFLDQALQQNASV